MNETRRRIPAWPAAALAVIILAVLAGPATPAAASCAAPVGVADAIGQADIVIVGTVSATRSRDRIATVAVEEIWKGQVDKTLEVWGGPAVDNEATSVDRTYQPGARYLLFVREPAAHGEASIFGGRYEDNSCSATQPWTAALATFRPATATITSRPSATAPVAAPVAAGGRGQGAPAWAIVSAAALVVVLAALGLVAWRRGQLPAVP